MAAFAMALVGGLKLGAIYGLAALGLVAIHKATQVVNFAHGALVMLGGFGAYLVVVAWRWPYWTAYLLVPAAVGGLAMLLELALLRPLRRADPFAVVVATIFLGVVLSELYRLGYNTEVLAVPGAVAGRPFLLGPLAGGWVIVTREQLWVIGGALSAAVAGLLLFRYAGVGRSMRAMAANVRGAQLCGYSLARVYAVAWLFGGALAGLAGVFAAPSKGVSPDLAVAIISSAFVAAVLGGFDSLGGAIAGGLILGVLETLAAAYVSSAANSAISFVVLFAVLMIRPQGLFPQARVRGV